jgi:hypothetical protein
MNVAYMGMNNPVSVQVPGFRSDSLVVKSSVGKVLGSSGNYIWEIPWLRHSNIETFLSIFIKNGDTLFYAGRKLFRIMSLPNPTPAFGEKLTGGDVCKEEVLEAKEIIIIPVFTFDGLEFQVTKFKFIHKPAKGKGVLFASKSEKLSEEMLAELKQVEVGSMIIITNIFAKSKEGRSKQLPGSIVLTIK